MKHCNKLAKQHILLFSQESCGVTFSGFSQTVIELHILLPFKGAPDKFSLSLLQAKFKDVCKLTLNTAKLCIYYESITVTVIAI